MRDVPVTVDPRYNEQIGRKFLYLLYRNSHRKRWG